MSDSDNKELELHGFNLDQILDEAKRLDELYKHQQRKYRHDHADTQYGTMRVPVKLLIALIKAYKESGAEDAYDPATTLEDAVRKTNLLKKRYELHRQECSVDATAKRTVKHHEGDMVFELDADAHPTWDDVYAIDTSEWDQPSLSIEDFLNLAQTHLAEGEDPGSISKEKLAELIGAKLNEDGIAIPKKVTYGHPYTDYLDEHGFLKIKIEPEFSKGTWKESVREQLLSSLQCPPPVVGAEGINPAQAALAWQAQAKSREEHSLVPSSRKHLYPVFLYPAQYPYSKVTVTIGQNSPDEPVYGWAISYTDYNPAANPMHCEVQTPSGEPLRIERSKDWPYQKTELVIGQELPVYLVSDGVCQPKVSLYKPKGHNDAQPYGNLCTGGYHCRECLLIETGREVTVYLAPENR